MLCSYEELTEATADDHYGENKSYEPQETPSLERTVLLQQIIDELIEEVRAIDPECGTILDLIKEAKENKDIITNLGYGTSHGYTRIKDAHNKAKELYYKD